MFSEGTAKIRFLPWIALGILLSPLLMVCARVVLTGTPDLAVEGDLAMLDISTRNLAEGRSLLGPYSRFGFNHPGPAYLFLRMPLHFITGGSGSASYITVPLIICVCLAAAFILVKRQCGATLSIVFCLLMLLYLLQTTPVVWLRDWNPFVILFPFLLFVSACAAVASGRTGWFPAAVVSGSLVAQTHLGGAPVVLALLLFLLPVHRLFAPVEPVKGSHPGRHIVTGLVLGVALWLPVLVQELAPGEGNMTRIFRFLAVNPSAVGLKTALREWSGALTASEIGFLAPRFLRSRGILFQVVFVMALLRLFFITGCAVLLRKTGRSPFMTSLAVLLIVTHLVMFFGVLQVRGDLHEYLFCWFSVTSPLSWFVFIGTIAVFARGKTSRFRVIPAILTLLAVPVALSVAGRLEVFDTGVFDPLGYHDEGVGDLSRELAPLLDSHGGRSWFLEPIPRDLWPVSVGVVNRLSRGGFDIHLDPFFGALVGTVPPEGATQLVLSERGHSGSMAVDTVCTPGASVMEPSGGSL
jgi:hypothetical protein